VGLALVLGAAGLGTVRAQDAKEKESTPESRAAIRQRTSEVLTNIGSSTGIRKDGLRELQDEINRSFRNFTPNSLDGLAAPRFQPSPIVPNPKLKDMLDRKRNWALSTPEEILNIPDPEKILNPDKASKSGGHLLSVDDYLNGGQPNSGQPNGQKGTPNDRKFNGSMEGAAALLDPTNRRDDRDTDRDRDQDSSKDKLSDSEREGRLPEGLRGTEEKLRKGLLEVQGTSFLTTPNKSSFSDFFGLGDQVTPKEQEESHKAYLKEYQGILNSRSPAADNFVNQFGPLPGAAESVIGGKTPAYKPAELPSSSRRVSDAQLGMINPSFDPNPVANVNSKVLNSWDPLKTAPAPVISAPKPAPLPNFQAPRRVF